MADMDFGAYI